MNPAALLVVASHLMVWAYVASAHGFLAAFAACAALHILTPYEPR